MSSHVFVLLIEYKKGYSCPSIYVLLFWGSLATNVKFAIPSSLVTLISGFTSKAGWPTSGGPSLSRKELHGSSLTLAPARGLPNFVANTSMETLSPGFFRCTHKLYG